MPLLKILHTIAVTIRYTKNGLELYLPMSALYDGIQYLIEKYTVYIAPSAALTDTKEKLPAGTRNSPVLAMGLSEPHGNFIIRTS